TPRGICKIAFGEDGEALQAELRAEFPEGEHLAGDAELEQLAALVLAVIDQGKLPQGIPLDLMGTAFQRRVWRALQEVPPGSTVSYAELAERIGAKGAARAVGHACGSNRVAVCVPCHRVLRGDGSVGGYRWGLGRKREILDREQEKAHPPDEPAEVTER